MDGISQEFSRAVTGQPEAPPRWRRCVAAASGSLATAVGSMYVRRHFSGDSKAAAVEMVAEIR
jgi:membrane metallo-endopeptidase-like protein 1